MACLSQGVCRQDTDGSTFSGLARAGGGFSSGQNGYEDSRTHIATGNARLSAVRISMDRADARLCSHESGVYSSCSQDVMEVCHQQDRNDVAAQHCFSHFFTSAEWPRHLMEDMDGSVL